MLSTFSIPGGFSETLVGAVVGVLLLIIIIKELLNPKGPISRAIGRWLEVFSAPLLIFFVIIVIIRIVRAITTIT